MRRNARMRAALLLAALTLLAGCRSDAPQISPTPSATAPATMPHIPTAPPTAPLPEPTPPLEEPIEPTAPAPAVVTHTVAAGDTLLGLALQYGVPMAAIQLQNGLGSSTVVRLGQVVSIPPRAAWEGASPFWVVHVVERGDTLSAIGQTYGIRVGDLSAANALVDADVLAVGQQLVVPLNAPAVVRAPEPTARPSATAPPAAATAPAVSAASPPGAPPAPPPADVADWPREVVRLMNQTRAEHGLPPLVYNELLAQAGQMQANDCAQRRSCSHTGSDGSDIKTRILRTGYNPRTWAECWAIRQTPQGAIDIWMDEVPPNDPHRRTLLTTWLTEIGVGVAEAHWGYYFIAVFGTPLN